MREGPIGEDERERMAAHFKRYEPLYQKIVDALGQAIESGDNWSLLMHVNYIGKILEAGTNARLAVEREAQGLETATFN